MANGYLGKISAIVSANTADFQKKIDASAQDVDRFARRIGSDLNAASRQASRSLENIYTPLQKVERALKAANSMKLSFQGFKGAVRTVEELSQRLAELGKRQIDISVRGTGFKTAAQLHDAIRGISSKEVNLVASVGGLKEARELVASMQAADEYGKRRGVAFGKDTSTGAVVKVRQTQLEEAVAKLAQFRDLDQIKIALKVVGTQQLDEATRKFKQMVSLGQEVTAPLEKIQSELSSFPADIQAAFQPTLIELQKRTERVSASIEKVGTTGRTFNRLAADVRGATQSVGFLSEAVASLGAINARGLVDRTPAFKQALDSSAAATKMRDSQPAFVTRNADVGALDERRLDAVKKLVAAYAKLEGEEGRGGASAKTNRQFEKQIALVKQLTDSFNELVASTKGAAFDEIALQANRANAIFSSLSPQAARGLLGLQQQAAGLVDAYKLTGQGAAEAEAAVKRFAAASATAAGGDRLRGAADALGVGTPLSGVESAAAKAQAAFDALPESLRAKFQPELQRTLKEAAALGDTVAASGDKGDGAIERMISRLRGLQSSFQTTGGAADIGQTLASALSRVRVSQPLNLSEIARQATEAVGEFETLSAPIRRQLIPAFSEAINRAADLTKKIADGGRASAVEIAKVASAVGGLTERIKGAKDASALLNTGLFRNPGGSVGVDQLNQDVKALSDTFKTLPASSRAILLPFVEEVRGARTALREGTGSVRDYQAAVAALAAANRSTGATAGAFVSDSSAAGRARDAAEIEARINAASQASESFGRAGRRSLQELAEGARAASAAFAAGTGSIADARRAVDDLEASVSKAGRLEGISGLFRVGSEATKLRQLSDSAAALNDRFQALDITQRRALQGLAGSLRESLQAAEKAGTATPALKKDYEALLAAIAGSETATASIKSLEADLKALQGRLVGIRSNLDLTITGKFQNATQLGSAIEKLTADIEKLDAAGRTLFAGRIKLLIDAVDAGKLTEAQQDAKDLRADLDAAIVLKLDDDKADAKLKSLTAAVAKFREDAAFAITGRPQNMDQADSRLSQLRGDVGSMDAATSGSYAGLFDDAALAKEADDLKAIIGIIDQIEKKVQSDKEFKVTTDKAKAEADRLKATFDSLVDQSRQLATGVVQNRSQAESAVSSAMGRAANLDPARFAKIKQAMDDATASLSNGGFNPALIQQFAQLVDAEIEAKKKADELTESMRRIGDQIAPSAPIEVLKKTIAEAEAAIKNLDNKKRSITVVTPPSVSGDSLKAAEDRVDEIRGKRDTFAGVIASAEAAHRSVFVIEADLQRVSAAMRGGFGPQMAKFLEDNPVTGNIDELIQRYKKQKKLGLTSEDYSQDQLERLRGDFAGNEAATRRLDLQSRVGYRGDLGAAFNGPMTGRDSGGTLRSLEDDYDKVFASLVGKKKALEDELAAAKLKPSVDTSDLDKLDAELAEAESDLAALRKAALTPVVVSSTPGETMRETAERDLQRVGGFVRSNAGDEDAIKKATEDAARIRDEALANAPKKEAAAARNPLGEQLGSAARSIDNVQGRVVSLQNEIEKLPAPIQARMIPAVNEVRAAFESINATSTQAEIDKVIAKAMTLEKTMTRVQRESKLEITLGEGLEDAAFKKAEKQIGFMQSKLLELGATASGPVSDAFNKYSSFVAQAAGKGTLGLAKNKAEAEQLAAALADAALKAGLFKSKSESLAFVKNVGDVGRQGVDKWSLALNQAAFAVDDFLSSTGGIEFKLRAVSNNITQLAFVLGGTTGLFVGLGAVLAGQAAVALIRWANNGRSAEDQTRALNDALARQKNLVEELGQSFKSLGDSVARGLFSDAGEKAADFARQLEAIQRKQAEVAAERRAAANSSPAAPQNLGRTIGELYAPPLRRQEFEGVAEIRAELNKLQKELEGATTAGERAITQGRIRTTRQQERAALNRLSVEPAPDDTVVRSAVRNSASESGRAASVGQFLFSNIVTGFSSLLLGIDRKRTSQTVDAAGRLRRLSGEVGSDPQSQIEVLRRAQELKRPEASQRDFFGLIKTNSAISAEQEIAKFEELIQSLQNVVDKGLNKTAEEIATAARGPAEAIRQAQEEVAKAIEAGLPGARLFGLELDAAAKRLEEANKRLEQFASGKDENGRELTDAEREKRVSGAKAEVDTLRRQQAAIEARTDGFRRERTLDPQRQIDARMGRAAGNLQAAGLEDGQVARRMREIEYQRETIRQQAQKPEFQNPMAMRLLEQQEAALNAEAAAIEAVTIRLKVFADALNRATEEARGNLNSAQQAADEARRADLGMSTPQTQEARRRTEADLERQRELEQQVRTEAKVTLERQAIGGAGPLLVRLQQIDEELKSGDGAKKEELIREQAQIQAKIDAAVRARSAGVNNPRDASTREAEQAKAAARGEGMAKTPEQRFKEETDAGMESIRQYFGRKAEDEDGLIDIAGQREAEKRYMEERDKEFRQQTSVGRGRDLGMTEQARFARDIREGAAKDLGAAAKEMPAADRAAFLRQGIANQMEQVAPMFKQFEDERRTAQLQGPSRAALQVSDVTTTGGASELTRLLRGDDSAKNENLAELRRQSDKLDEVVKAVRESAPGVL